ncbi:MAG: S8 family serine peptidase [Candidatus Sumerlaeaceae bacterium]
MGKWLVLVLTSVICTLSVQATAKPEKDYVAGELLVKYAGKVPSIAERDARNRNGFSSYSDASTSLTEILQKHGFQGAKPRGHLRSKSAALNDRSGRIHRLKFPASADIQQIAIELREVVALEYAEPNHLGTLAVLPPTDPDYLPQQATDFAQVNLEAGWAGQATAGGSNVKVAVIDSGVDRNHPDLMDVLDLANSYNFADDNTTIADDLGHGTRVAGIIAAEAYNNEGIAGVAFGSSILSLDVANSGGFISADDAARAVDRAVIKNAHVINMSIRFSSSNTTLKEACDGASAAGVLVVAAAGNEGQGSAPVYPASWPSVVGVGALDDAGKRAAYSNYNGTQRDLVDLFAPGNTIYSTIPGGLYNGNYGSGTSYACPIVSGVGALVKASNPLQGGPAIADHLKRTASSIAEFSPSDGAGFGKVNAAAAITTAMNPMFSVASIIVDDNTTLLGSNNADGRLDAGETANLAIMLYNGRADTGTFSATLSTTETLASVLVTTSSWNALTHGNSGLNVLPLQISLSGLATAAPRYFTLSISANGGSYSQALSIVLTGELKEYIAGGSYFSPLNWTNNKTYVLQGGINVQSGLSIQPGTTVLVEPQASLDLLSGTLTAQGTVSQPITFTGASPRYDLTTTDDDLVTATRAGGLKPSHATAITSLPDGGYAITGFIRSSASFKAADGSVITITSPNYSEPFVARYSRDGFVLWAKSFHSSLFSYKPAGSGISADSSGNVVVVGRITGTTVFGSGEPNETSISVTGAVSFDYTEPFIAKFNGTSGQLIWARRIANSSTSNNYASGVAPTADNGFIVTGDFTSSITLGAAPGTVLTSTGSLDGFLAKYNSAGTLLWAKQFGTSGAVQDSSRAVCAFPDQSCTVVGAIGGNAVFGLGESPGPGAAGQTNVSNASGGVGEIFVSHFNANGTLAWVKTAGSPSSDQAYAVSGFADGSAMVTGYFNNTAIFGAAEFYQTTLVSGGREDIFVARYNADGTLAWAKRAGASIIAPLLDIGFAVATNSDGSCYIGGRFRGDAGFGLNDNPTTLSSNADCAYIAKYRSDGTLAWAKPQGGTDNVNTANGLFGDTCSGLAALPNGDVVSCGWIDNTAYFGTAEPRSIALVAQASSDGDQTGDIFVAKFAGSLGWGGIHISGSSSGANLEHCKFQRGALTNQHSATTIKNCTSEASPRYGIQSDAGTAAVDSCDVLHSRGSALTLGARNALNCSATWSRGHGLQTNGSAVDCAVNTCNGDGLLASGVTNGTAAGNAARGIVSAGSVTSSSATSNGGAGILCTAGNVSASTSQSNGGVGISINSGGTALNCTSNQNGSGGIAATAGSTVNGCSVKGNTGTGVAGSGSSSVVGSTISGNTGSAASGVTTLQDSAVSANGSGLNGVTNGTRNYVGGNFGFGINNGNVSDSSIVGNTGNGIQTNGTVAGCIVIGNGAAGVSGSNAATLTNCSVTSNTTYGVTSLGSSGITGSNLFGNLAADAHDNQLPLGGGGKTFSGNFWGTSATLLMNTNPSPYDIDPYIQDGRDGTSGFYLNYSPHAPNLITSALSTSAPTCLLNASPPDGGKVVDWHPTTFTLTFSRDMNQSISPAVTFARTAPYTQNVLEAVPGWVNARTWQGRHAPQSASDDGTNTLRISQARDVNGFVVPDDTRNKFAILFGQGAANNGQVIIVSGVAELHFDEQDKPSNLLTYRIMRSSQSGTGPWSLVNENLPLTSSPFIDNTLNKAIPHWYRVDVQTNDFIVSPEFTVVIPYGAVSNVGNWALY